MTTTGNLAGGHASLNEQNCPTCGQKQPQPPQKPKGFFNKVLHGVGTGLKVLGETVITIALSGEGAFQE